jgi:hypothetical protein
LEGFFFGGRPDRGRENRRIHFPRIREEHTKGDAVYKIFRTPVHHLGPSNEPDYMLYEGKLFPTATHPHQTLPSL